MAPGKVVMNTYISMLRGINVSGQKIIRMEELASLYESLGFKNVRTYVQSGNVLFDSPITEGSRLSGLIADKIKKAFGFFVVVVLRTRDELQAVVQNNPFLKERGIDPARLHVTFLLEAPDQEALSRLQAVKDRTDRIKAGSREVYLHCPQGYGRTKYSNHFIERTLKVSATTRNWNTVLALLGMAGK
jgi:uncharacterized protein (DUF1697 family)